jgi:transaldolase
MIKVPGTSAGLAAIQALITEGINVNVTLLFGLARYGEVVHAFMSGLEQRAKNAAPLERVASVASFFVSRIDTLADARLDALGTEQARELRGKAATASAQLAFDAQREWIAGDRWKRLAARGARPQRLLWASTSTKDPTYPDTKYVEALIGPRTVNTMTRSTLDAYRDHGEPRVRVTDDLDRARAALAGLRQLGIDPEEVSRQLEREGVRKFDRSLLSALGAPTQSRAALTYDDSARLRTSSADLRHQFCSGRRFLPAADGVAQHPDQRAMPAVEIDRRRVDGSPVSPVLLLGWSTVSGYRGLKRGRAARRFFCGTERAWRESPRWRATSSESHDGPEPKRDCASVAAFPARAIRSEARNPSRESTTGGADDRYGHHDPRIPLSARLEDLSRLGAPRPPVGHNRYLR